MSKWNLIVDVAECTNCNNCTLAAMDEYIDNDWPGYSAPMPKHGHRWIDILQKERGAVPCVDVAYVPTMCNHCDDAPCMAEAKDGAITKRADGIVVIDPVKAKGQKQLVDACPYGHIWWNEELELPQAWNFDAHLLDGGWDKTRGSQACATGAMKAIKVSDAEMARMAEAEGLDRIFIEAGFEWRLAGCSMCLAMNPDQLAPGERCAATSNRNFEGRQGRGGRTHLMSPEMAAAAAITGRLTDVREMQ